MKKVYLLLMLVVALGFSACGDIVHVGNPNGDLPPVNEAPDMGPQFDPGMEAPRPSPSPTPTPVIIQPTRKSMDSLTDTEF